VDVLQYQETVYLLLVKIFIDGKVSISNNRIGWRTRREVFLPAPKAQEFEESVNNARRQESPEIGKSG
jgi:hypothetical protein